MCYKCIIFLRLGETSLEDASSVVFQLRIRSVFLLVLFFLLQILIGKIQLMDEPKPPLTDHTSVSGSNLKYVSLVVLTLQNAVLILIMRYVRVRKGDMFISSTAVVMTELLKLIASLTFIFIEQGMTSVCRVYHC